MAGFTNDQLAALERSIALGIKVVEQHGKRTEFQSVQQMLQLRDRMKNELAASAPGSMPACMTRPTYYNRG